MTDNVKMQEITIMETTNAEQPRRQIQSETIGELAKAMCAVQKTKLLSLTDSENPFLNSRYANLASVWSAIRDPLTANGFAIIQTTEPHTNGVTVVTTLMHSSGEWVRGWLSSEIVPDKKGTRTPQGLLSLITYLRRAGVAAITGVCPTDDDDGNLVSGNDTTPPPKPSKKTPALNVDEHVKINYKLPGEDSQAMKDLKEYKPSVEILDKDNTKFKIGKFLVEISADGKHIWSNVPKFNDVNFDMSACVPCALAGLIRAHGVPFITGKYEIEITKEQ